MTISLIHVLVAFSDRNLFTAKFFQRSLRVRSNKPGSMIFCIVMHDLKFLPGNRTINITAWIGKKMLSTQSDTMTTACGRNGRLLS